MLPTPGSQAEEPLAANVSAEPPQAIHRPERVDKILVPSGASEALPLPDPFVPSTAIVGMNGHQTHEFKMGGCVLLLLVLLFLLITPGKQLH